VARRREPGYARALKGSRGFYADVAGFSDFSRFPEEENYRTAPDDWLVVVTDIERSSEAVAAGRYKDVNMVAAASIVAVLNVAGEAEIPFVFGGDGATLLIPPEAAAPVRAALAKLAQLSTDSFHLPLRVGMVPIAELTARGRAVRVARFQLSPGNTSALFAGGGVELAEALVKSPGTSGVYSVRDDGIDYEDLDLAGLSCRWEPLQTRRGVVFSVLIQALAPTADGAAASYRAVMACVREILGEAPDAGNPVAPESLRFRWPPRGLWLEARALAAGRSPWRLWPWLLLESFLQGMIDRFGLTAGGMDGRRYRDELRLNSDFRRFNDTLRMVFDCTAAQAAKIEDFLVSLHEDGEVAYGVHRTDAALMTCLVFSLERSDHMHFLDGTNGGFTLAAREMKAQLADWAAPESR
jgi:Protein of unknown function (DUF3095)